MVQSKQIPVARLEPGDIIRQVYSTMEDGLTVTASRYVVIGSVEQAALPYKGHVHAVTRVMGLDVKQARAVAWIAVPDQPLMVIRTGA